jgi:hypothetical protein
VTLAEMNENAGLISRAWAMAVLTARSDPDHALEELIEAEIHLNHHLRLELRDALRNVRAAINRLDRELPDNGEVSEPTSS